MRRHDLAWAAAWAAALLALAGPALWRSGWTLFNFGDLATYHLPMRHLAAAQLQSGRMPFWNPYILSGVPLLANPQSVLFYPGAVLSWIFPLSNALAWDSILHLLWAAAGMTLLARREGLRAPAAAALACGYALSPFLVYRVTAGIPTLLAALAWVPWWWLAALSGRRGLLGAVAALQLLSGHPQFLVVNAAGTALWLLFKRAPISLWGSLALEAAITLPLAVLQWAPTAEFLSHSVRREWPEAFAAAYSVGPAAWPSVLLPGVFGTPIDGSYAGLPSFFFEACGAFIGAPLLAAAALGAPRALSALGLAAAGLLLATGGGAFLASALLRTPARWLLLTVWGLTSAAGSTLRRAGPSASAAVFALTLLQLGLWARPFLRAQDARLVLEPNSSAVDRLWGPFRVLTKPEIANPNKTMLYRALNVNGYEAFYLAGYAAYAAASEGAPAADSSRVFMSRTDTPQMKEAGVSVVIGRDGISNVGGGLGLAFNAKGGVALSRTGAALEREDRWRVRGRLPDGGDRVVLGLPRYPGWRAWLDGKPAALEPWGGYFQAVRVPGEQGRVYEVSAAFRPTLWPLLAALSVAAWLALAAGCAKAWRPA